jgi:hypothetical protein
MVCCNNSLETLRWQLMMMLLPLLYYLVSCFSLSLSLIKKKKH